MKKYSKMLIAAIIAIALILVCSFGFAGCFLIPNMREEGNNSSDNNNNDNNDNNNDNNDNNDYNDNNDTPYQLVYNGLVFRLTPDYIPSYEVTGVDSNNQAAIITVPDECRGLPVKQISGSAFNGCTNLTEIILPDSIDYIGYGAFSGCTSLVNMTIPASVQSIGDSTFSGCTALNSINIPAAVISIGDNVFKGCKSLSDITVDDANYWYSSSDGVIYDKAKTEIKFVSEAVADIDIPSTVTKIADTAFSDCDKITGLVLPDGINSIGICAFENCTALNRIVIPNSLSSYGSSIFLGCDNITEAILPSGLFRQLPASKLKTAGICSGEVASNEFDGFTKLESVDLGSCRSIGMYAFSGCRSLTEITLPAEIVNIGGSAFSGCSGLTKVNYKGDIAQWCKISFANELSNPLYYARNLYLNEELVTEIVIPDDVTEIKPYTFNGCGSLTDLTFSNKLTAIGSSAFSVCSGLTKVNYKGDLSDWCKISFSNYVSNPLYYADNFYINDELITEIVIPAGITKIKENTFAGCGSLTKIEIPDTVTNIGNRAFYDCENITEAVLPAKYLSDIPKEKLQKVEITGGAIANTALRNCTELKSVTLSSNVTGIGNSAFYGCTKLGSVKIYNTDITVGSYAFSGCDNVTEVVLSVALLENFSKANLQNVEILTGEIGANEFDGCTALHSVILDGGVTKIGNEAFKDCTELTELNIPGSVTQIGQGVFGGCVKLSSVTVAENNPNYSSLDGVMYNKNQKLILFVPIAVSGDISLPDTLNTIGAYAFSGCDKITGIVIPSGVTSIGQYAFSGCAGLKSIDMANPSATVGEGAFSGCNSIIYAKSSYSVLSEINRASLQSVEVIGGNIPDNAFDGCSSLGSVTVSDGVTSIGNEAFKNCAGITSLHIPGGVLSIGEAAFVGCSNLRELTVDENNSNYSIVNNILYDERYSKVVFAPVNIQGKVVIQEYTRRIGNGAFYGCGNITGIEIPYTVTSLGADVFFGCNAITEAKLPASAISAINVKKLKKVEITRGVIAENAFSGCSLLSDIAITDVTGIGRGAFGGTAYYANQSKWTDDALYINDCLIKVRSSYSGAFEIREGTKVIADGAFSGCADMTGIDISSSVEYIGSDMFSGCNSIANAKLPVSAVSQLPKGSLQTVEIYGTGGIAANEFNGCTTLSSLTVSDGVTSIGNGAFGGCTQLTTVNIANSVGYIGSGAFSGTAYLDSAGNYENGVLYLGKCLISAKPSLSGAYSVKAGTTQIADGAFSGCVNLTGLTVPASVTSIGANVFEGCAGLSSVTVAEGNGYYGSASGILYNKGKTQILYVPVAVSGIITIPDTVTAIGDSVFEGRAGFTGIEIPVSVKSIGNNAFSGCASLSAVEIPVSVTTIGNNAFKNCISLNTVNLSHHVAKFGSNVFSGCGNIEEATVPAEYISEITKENLKTVTITSGEIEDKAFYNCTSLTNVTISEGVTKIGINAFSNCTSLIDVTISEGVTRIGAFAFSNCTGITDIVIPLSAIYVESSILDSCKIVNATLRIELIYAIPKEYLQTITITAGEIKNQAFNRFTELKAVNLCEGITTVKSGAFYELDGITSLHIPASVTSFAGGAIFNCANMESITVASGNANYCVVGGILYNKAVTNVVYAPPKLSGNITLPASVKTIFSCAFNGCSGLTGISIPDAVTGIGSYAFNGCISLNEIILPGSLTSIGNYAFCGCSGITSLDIPDTVTDIGNYAFSGLGISSLEIPASVKNIGDSAFKNCASLNSVSIPNSALVSSSAFSLCEIVTATVHATSIIAIRNSKLETVTITGGEIPDNAFNASKIIMNLTSVTISEGVTGIGEYAFSGCSGITELAIPKTVQTIGNCAFYNCGNLKKLTAHADNQYFVVKGGILYDKNQFTIYYALSSVSGLLNLRDSSVRNIAPYAFAGNENITELRLPMTVKQIGERAFYNCSNLNRITYRDTKNNWIYHVTKGSEWAAGVKTKYVNCELESLSGEDVDINL